MTTKFNGVRVPKWALDQATTEANDPERFWPDRISLKEKISRRLCFILPNYICGDCQR